MREFEVSNQIYTHTKLNAFKQLSICRKGAPFYLANTQGFGFNILSEMDEKDLQVLYDNILPSVQRKEPTTGKMIPLMTSGIIRFDIGAGDLVDIMFEVLQDYLPDFIESVKRRVSLAETMTVPTQDI